MRIEVTQEDIENGKPYSAWSCAIAVAIRRATRREIVWVKLGENTIALYRREIPLPHSVKEWAERFDEGRSVEPFTFDLDIPEKKR